MLAPSPQVWDSATKKKLAEIVRTPATSHIRPRLRTAAGLSVPRQVGADKGKLEGLASQHA